MKDFIDIKPEFTIDKGIDNSSPKAKPSSFTTLSNYIPEQGCIATRGGINEFSFIDASYDPSADPACVMWARFEVAALTICTINGAIFSKVNVGGNVIADAGNYKEGAASGDFDYGVGDNYLRVSNATLAGLQSTFPGMAAGTQDFLTTFWVKPDWLPGIGVTVDMIRKDPYGGTGFWGMLAINTTGTPYWRFIVNDGIGNDKVVTSAVAYTKVWWHVGMWHSTALGLMGLRLYNYAGGTVSNYTGVATSLGLSTSGYFNLGFNYFNGWIDDLIVCDECPATTNLIYSKIDTIRNRVL